MKKYKSCEMIIGASSENPSSKSTIIGSSYLLKEKAISK